MTRALERLAQKSGVALNYAEQFKKHIDPNDPKAESKMAYLDGVGLLFSQAMTLSHSANFAETLEGLRENQMLIAKKMSFFGREPRLKVTEITPDHHSCSTPAA